MLIKYNSNAIPLRIYIAYCNMLDRRLYVQDYIE